MVDVPKFPHLVIFKFRCLCDDIFIVSSLIILNFGYLKGSNTSALLTTVKGVDLVDESEEDVFVRDPTLYFTPEADDLMKENNGALVEDDLTPNVSTETNDLSGEETDDEVFDDDLSPNENEMADPHARRRRRRRHRQGKIAKFFRRFFHPWRRHHHHHHRRRHHHHHHGHCHCHRRRHHWFG